MTRDIVHPHPRTPGLVAAPKSHRNETRPRDEDRPLYDGLLARSFAKGIVERFRDGGHKAAIAGSLRRGHDLVHDIDILAALVVEEGVVDFTGLDLVHATPQKFSFRANPFPGSGSSEPRIIAEVRVVPIESWGSALQYYTGSRYHNIWLRSLAKHVGLSLSEYGFYKVEKDPVTNMVTRGPLIPIARESEVYKTLGLRWLPPRYRDKPNGHKGRYTPP